MAAIEIDYVLHLNVNSIEWQHIQFWLLTFKHHQLQNTFRLILCSIYPFAIFQSHLFFNVMPKVWRPVMWRASLNILRKYPFLNILLSSASASSFDDWFSRATCWSKVAATLKFALFWRFEQFAASRLDTCRHWLLWNKQYSWISKEKLTTYIRF